MRAWHHRVRAAAVVGALLAPAAACGREAGAASADGGAGTVGTTEGETDTEAPAGPGLAADSCEAAATVELGVHHDSLRGRGSTLQGACGRGGPDAFYAVEMPRRADLRVSATGAGFHPTVGVLPTTCAGGWAGRTLVCADGVEAWLLDVAAGTRLLVSVGIDPEDPVLEMLSPGDPLAFSLELRTREVLAPGEPCSPASRGRCMTGTACTIPAPEPGEAQAWARCVAVAGDTCAAAETIALALADTVQIEIDPATPYGDAHAHACGGARRRDAVVRVELGDPVVPGTRLDVSTPAAGVGLAVRGPTCAPTAALACDSGSAGGAAVSLGGPGTEAIPPVLFLMVELPPGEAVGDGPGEEPPFEIEIRSVPP